MQFFIGIVPPDDIKEKIVALQNAFSYKTIIEPHITLKAFSGLTEDKAWLPLVEKHIHNQNAFMIGLGNTAWFGDEVLYLSAESKEIYRLHHGLLEIINPSLEQRQKHFEGAQYMPHLTLAEAKNGILKPQIQSMELKAQQLLPINKFKVSFIRIFVQDKPDNRCDKLLDVFLMP